MSLVLFSTILLLCFTSSSAVDVLRTHQTIQDGETIVSANDQFELGFFSPGSGTNRYVGIWLKNISYGTIVWVANRDAPLSNTSGILRIDNKAISLFANATTNTIVWSSNTSRFVTNPVAQLLDTGNLVFRDEKDDGSQNFVWQSFDYIGDTMLPGMKLGTEGLNMNIVIWIDGYQGLYRRWANHLCENFSLRDRL
ncbi:Bulb-type lectin domain-containing protein [Heracleum sosnowskyi]|uniref:Bulb-type lectin domain-containing protein n=1 Tax=Heracleum sosnowskyi TaxID=360622 RepID=A0AAD8N1V0_9APIA|nr:Bulb-type lectin domain-containing protein [Heracleum sosnowskyi]